MAVYALIKITVPQRAVAAVEIFSQMDVYRWLCHPSTVPILEGENAEAVESYEGLGDCQMSKL
jgi:hypothetical protein